MMNILKRKGQRWSVFYAPEGKLNAPLSLHYTKMGAQKMAKVLDDGKNDTTVAKYKNAFK